mmetsp:Transcript_19729/g.55747  ORF Transcript_19729/g.55747 Transcript_19729/m.55747 type:complete len:212 (-) Transcript_19729:1371-2006(-)
MVGLELLWSLGKADDDCVHRAHHNAHGDRRNGQPDDRANDEHEDVRPLTETGICPARDLIQQDAAKSRGCADHDAPERHDAGGQVVADDGRPAALSEEFHHLASGREVIVAEQSNVHDRPLCEVLRNARDQAQQAFDDAHEHLVAASMTTGSGYHCFQRADESNEQTCHANAAERVRRGASETVADRLRPHVTRLLWSKPPCSNHCVFVLF